MPDFPDFSGVGPGLREPLFPRPQPDLNFGNLPGFSGGSGLLMQMLLQPVLQQALGPNFIPGQMFPVQNPYDRIRQQRELGMQQEAIRAASAQSNEQRLEVMAGFARSIGRPWGVEQQRAFRQGLETYAPLFQTAALMRPDIADALSGVRGDPMAMAAQTALAGRYMFDPVTGRYGMSGATAGAVAGTAFRDLYSDPARLGLMRGIGAGEMGQFLHEATIRGMGPASLTREQTMQGLARQEAGSFGGDVNKALQALEGLSNPQLEARLRSFSAERVKNYMSSMADALSAMKDIMGPNAPMGQMIDAMNVLTQGGLHAMSGGEAARTVRGLATAARMGSMGVDQAAQLMASGAPIADQLGLNRGLLPEATTQAILGAQAVNTVSGDARYFGRLGDQERLALHRNLELGAMASPAANQMAATLRLGQEVGFTAGSEAEALFKALQGGQTEYTFGDQNRSVYDRNRWQEVMQTGGVSAQQANLSLLQRTENQQIVRDQGLGAVARGLQQREVGQILRGTFGQAIQANLGGLGDSGQLADFISKKVFDMGAAGMDATAIAGQLEGQLKSQLGRDLTADERKRVLAAAQGGLGLATEDERIRRTYGTSRGAIENLNNEALSRQRRLDVQKTNEAELSGALSGLGRGGPLQRVMERLAQSQGKLSLQDALASALGWTKVDDKALGGLQQALGEDFFKRVEAVRTAGSAAEREQALGKLKEMLPGISAAAAKAGLSGDTPQQQLAGEDILGQVLGDLGVKVTDDQRKALAGKVMTGERGSMLREGMGNLRELSNRLGLEGADLARALKAGPAAGADERTKQLFDALKPLQGLGVDLTSPEQIEQALKGMAPWQDQQQPGGGGIPPGTPVTMELKVKGDVEIVSRKVQTVAPGGKAVPAMV